MHTTFPEELKQAISLNRDFVRKNKLKEALTNLQFFIGDFEAKPNDDTLRNLNGAWSRARHLLNNDDSQLTDFDRGLQTGESIKGQLDV